MPAAPIPSTLHTLPSRPGEASTSRLSLGVRHVHTAKDQCGLVQVRSERTKNNNINLAPRTSRYVTAEPKWAKQLEAEMKLGKFQLTFTAASPVGNKVISAPPPVCPPDLTSPHLYRPRAAA